jgi:hypothetical protein
VECFIIIAKYATIPNQLPEKEKVENWRFNIKVESVYFVGIIDTSVQCTFITLTHLKKNSTYPISKHMILKN